MDASPSTGQFLMLGALEVLLNQALAVHPQGAATLDRLAGKVIRVRAHAPDIIFYCLIDKQGIELLPEYNGDADVRIRGSAGQLLHRALLPPDDQRPPEDEGIRIGGDEQTVALLRTALDTFNLWEALRTWLREHVAMPEFLGLLRQHDPAMLERLQNMPQLVGQALEELRSQAAVQQQVLDELRSLKSALQAERRSDMLAITLGMLFLLLALMSATGTLPPLVGSAAGSPAGQQTWALAALGIALMLSRVFSRRYQ